MLENIINFHRCVGQAKIVVGFLFPGYSYILLPRIKITILALLMYFDRHTTRFSFYTFLNDIFTLQLVTKEVSYIDIENWFLATNGNLLPEHNWYNKEEIITDGYKSYKITRIRTYNEGHLLNSRLLYGPVISTLIVTKNGEIYRYPIIVLSRSYNGKFWFVRHDLTIYIQIREIVYNVRGNEVKERIDDKFYQYI